MIQLDGVWKQIGYQPVLRDVTLTISAGETIRIVGANGAGKTTLLRLIAGLTSATRGTIQVYGFSLPQQAARIRNITAYLSDTPMLYGMLSAEENIRFFSALYGFAPQAAALQTMLKQLGLHARRQELVRTFSRGMKQRLQLALLFLSPACLLLLDEPFNSLDEQASQWLEEGLHQRKAQGHTILLVHHHSGDQQPQADRTLLLRYGQVSWQMENPQDDMKPGLERDS